MASLSEVTVKKRYLVNNILNILMFGSSWCLLMAQTQFSLIKKKDWTSRTLANPPSLTSEDILFCLNLPPPHPFRHPLKVDVICLSPCISWLSWKFKVNKIVMSMWRHPLATVPSSPNSLEMRSLWKSGCYHNSL